MFATFKNSKLLTSLVQTNPFKLLANFHTLLKNPVQPPKPALLSANPGDASARRGMKVMGLVRRRCKNCYMVMRENRLYNMCKTHGRHKQMAVVKKPRNTWILTHATQGKIRPW